VCVQTCANGWTAVAGASNSTCNGQAWNDAPLVCQPYCVTRGVPNFTSACTQSLYRSNFGALQSDVWADLTLLPPAMGPYLSVATGALLAAARPSAGDELIAVARSPILGAWRQGFKWSARMTPAGNRLGLAFRIQDRANFYRAVIDPSQGLHSIGGAPVPLLLPAGHHVQKVGRAGSQLLLQGLIAPVRGVVQEGLDVLAPGVLPALEQEASEVGKHGIARLAAWLPCSHALDGAGGFWLPPEDRAYGGRCTWQRLR
jgi:hypothetical protein